MTVREINDQNIKIQAGGEEKKTHREEKKKKEKTPV